MPKPNDPSRSLVTLNQDSTLIAVIEMGLANWLVAGVVPGVDRQPLKKIAADPIELDTTLRRWKEQAEKAGRAIARVTVAFEAGRDRFWLTRISQLAPIRKKFALDRHPKKRR
jgi:transposase